jgi:uncharacterized protein (TIGR02246 family)
MSCTSGSTFRRGQTRHFTTIGTRRYFMNKFPCALAFLLLLSTGLCTTAAVAGQSEDEAAIRDIQKEQADAWNRHDAAGYARLFTEDGDVVNVLGWWWRGRAQIESKLEGAFAFVFHESRLTITETSVRFLTPTIAVAHVRWTLEGARTPPGGPEPREGIQIQILQKTAGRWLIQSFQNTNAIPERPFPSGPPAATPNH